MYKVIKLNFGYELNGMANKTYTTKEAAENAGNSWLRDCTVDQNIRRGRHFEIVKELNK
jgi:hypothetical protein